MSTMSYSMSVISAFNLLLFPSLNGEPTTFISSMEFSMRMASSSIGWKISISPSVLGGTLLLSFFVHLLLLVFFLLLFLLSLLVIVLLLIFFGGVFVFLGFFFTKWTANIHDVDTTFWCSLGCWCDVIILGSGSVGGLDNFTGDVLVKNWTAKLIERYTNHKNSFGCRSDVDVVVVVGVLVQNWNENLLNRDTSRYFQCHCSCCWRWCQCQYC